MLLGLDAGMGGCAFAIEQELPQLKPELREPAQQPFLTTVLGCVGGHNGYIVSRYIVTCKTALVQAYIRKFICPLRHPV